MKLEKKFLLCLLNTSFFFAPWSLSKDHSSNASVIDNIIVTAKRDQQLKTSLIGSATRANQEDIAITSQVHINQIGTRFPGVWISRGNGQEHLTSVRSPVFTGSGSCAEVLVSEDEVPIRPTGLCNVNQIFEVNAEQAQGLEIWRGPGTVFYGSNAMHGVVNFLSPSVDQNYLSGGIGSNNYRKIRAGIKRQLSKGFFQLAANGDSDEGYKDSSGFEQQKVSLKHAYSAENIDITTHLSATNLNQETAGYIKGFETYKDRSVRKLNPNPEAFRDAQSLRLTSKVEGSILGHEWTATPYFRKSKMTFLQHYLPGQPTESNGQYSNGVQSSLKIQNTDMDLRVGIDLENANMYVNEIQKNPLGVPDNVRFQGKHYDFKVRSNQFSFFGDLERELTASTKLEAGFRFENLRYQYKNKMISGTTRDDGSDCNSSDGACRYFRPDDRTDTFENVNYHLGVNYQLNLKNQLFVRYATAFRAPQINQIYRLQKEQNVANVVSQDLDSFEIGLRSNSNDIAIELSGYLLNKKNVIIKDTNNFVVNDGQTDHRGIEWLIRYKLSDRMELITNGSYAIHEYDYSRLYGGIDIDGNKVDTAPKLLTNLRLKYKSTKGFVNELEIVHLDKYFLDPQNLHSYPGHTIANLRFSRAFNDITVSGQIINLMGELIAERADYGFGSYRYFVGEERGIFLQLQKVI